MATKHKQTIIGSLLAALFLSGCNLKTETTDSPPPNFIIIFADDLGYGDLSSYGHPSIKTPALDQMAIEGQRWTNFYVGASVCTPSRAALLTGRLPVRSGMSNGTTRVLFPDSKYGLPETEITLAEQLKTVGYATAAIGKWHLGHKEQYLPTNNGFDYYFGIPYSNDMDIPQEVLEATGGYWNFWQDPNNIKVENFNVPLLRNTTVIERPADQNTITQRFTEETIRYIKEKKDQPFFVYLAHSLPHVPLFASKAFLGTSERGLYGDVLEEIDHGIGQIITTLKEEGLAENTIVVFTSDNGPWLTFREAGGSAGLLRAGKGTTWEGGMREPAIFWGPTIIQPAVVSDLGATMDLFTTFSKIAGAPLPEDRILDGKDLAPTLFNLEESQRKSMLYYRGTEVYAARLGDFKAHYITQGEYGQFGGREVHDPPLLYNLSTDPSEQYNIAEKHPDMIKAIADLVEEHRQDLVIGKDQLGARE